MRPLYCILLAAALGACAPQTVTAPSPPALPTHTLIPAPTEIPAETPTLEPIALAGLPMEVGSMWPYVDGSVLVAVPAGEFVMGHGGSDNPEHTVTLSDFWIYQGKVTNQQYALCVNAGKCKPPDPVDDFTFSDLTHANDPVVGVNYRQASEYCAFVHGRLPTEAEWEKTARGPDGNLYPWGSNAPVCDVLNFNNCVGGITDTTTYPVGQSYYHALDMEGNVFEWVADWYDALYYANGPLQDPAGPESGGMRSVRSSSYKSKAPEIPASTRRFDGPNSHRRDLGFRCVVDEPGFFAPRCQSVPSQAGLLESECPRVSIGLTESCQQGIVTVVVIDDHSPDPAAVVSGVEKCSPASVTPGSFPQIYECMHDTTVKITTVCNYTVTAPATCAEHFTLNPSTGMCEWDGSLTNGKECLPGMAYDEAARCCKAGRGLTEYPVCPLGQALGYVAGQPVCIPGVKALNKPSDSELVHVQDPSTCSGTKTGACTLTEASCKSQCPYGGVFVPKTCSCVCYRG